MRLSISALVVSCNEGHLLEDCLKSLRFCDEIYGVDLSSDDNSLEIFRRHADQCEQLERVPLVEQVHPLVVPKLKHDWIILIDPDERITEQLAASIKYAVESAEDDIAALRVPMINYFRGKPLKGTKYGGVVYARLLYRRSGINLSDSVHVGIQMKMGYNRKKIRFNGNNFDMHLWCNSWAQLLDKHKRYLMGEGKARYSQGIRYSLKEQLKSTMLTFYHNYKGRKGYNDGLTGFIISILEARYQFIAWKNLKRFQSSMANLK